MNWSSVTVKLLRGSSKYVFRLSYVKPSPYTVFKIINTWPTNGRFLMCLSGHLTNLLLQAVCLSKQCWTISSRRVAEFQTRSVCDSNYLLRNTTKLPFKWILYTRTYLLELNISRRVRLLLILQAFLYYIKATSSISWESLFRPNLGVVPSVVVTDKLFIVEHLNQSRKLCNIEQLTLGCLSVLEFFEHSCFTLQKPTCSVNQDILQKQTDNCEKPWTSGSSVSIAM